MALKSLIYRAGLNLLRLIWRASGGRKINAFGHELLVTHDTIFPDYRKLRLPRAGCLSEIVKYADYVQIHAVCNFVSGLKNPPVIIDVGAHHGAYAILIGQIVKSMRGKVIAIEPNPESFKVLRNNVRLNRLEEAVICEQLAVADQEGTTKISFDGTQSHITEHTDTGTTVEMTTLQQLCKKHKVGHIDLLLIDVEGEELPVLRGFPWQDAKVDRIMCELHPYAWKDFGYGKDDFTSFLMEHNCRCFDMYLKEHVAFEDTRYIGPTFFVRGRGPISS